MDFFKTVFVLALLAASGTAQAPISWNHIVRNTQTTSISFNGKEVKGCETDKLLECYEDVAKDFEDLFAELEALDPVDPDAKSIDCLEYNQYLQQLIFCTDLHCDGWGDVCDTSEIKADFEDILEHCSFVVFCNIYEFALAIWAGLVAVSLILVVPSILIVKSKNPAYVDGKIVLVGLLSCLLVVLGPIIYIIFICIRAGNTQTAVATKV